jgi:hypothetical protein
LPTILFITATILAPDEPARIQSWRDYFYSIRVRLFVTGIIWVAVVVLVSTVILEMPAVHPLRLTQAGMLACFIAGALSDRPRVHATLAAAVPLLFGLAALRFLAEPGSLLAAP